MQKRTKNVGNQSYPPYKSNNFMLRVMQEPIASVANKKKTCLKQAAGRLRATLHRRWLSIDSLRGGGGGDPNKKRELDVLLTWRWGSCQIAVHWTRVTTPMWDGGSANENLSVQVVKKDACRKPTFRCWPPHRVNTSMHESLPEWRHKN